MKLTEAPLGALLRVERATLDAKTTLRLGEIGLRTGCLVCVMQRTVFGGTVVVCGGHRLALDKATAAGVRACPVATADTAMETAPAAPAPPRGRPTALTPAGAAA
ncbi:MAG: ferrous iron transport protein A [Bifidobacteriaceae bacterium]|nr:ferrous iron transport protein A [Bifidobacteriaceae bacterium]